MKFKCELCWVFITRDEKVSYTKGKKTVESKMVMKCVKSILRVKFLIYYLDYFE